MLVGSLMLLAIKNHRLNTNNNNNDNSQEGLESQLVKLYDRGDILGSFFAQQTKQIWYYYI